MDRFNPHPPTTMHVDINSCFATIEQQANPLLRGRPVAVAAYVKEYGCILAASREAKELGVKTGMRVGEGRALAPSLAVLPADPPKYRAVNRQMLSILQSYTAHVRVESIDEMVMNLAGTPALSRLSITGIANEIKLRIKQEIGEWITVSCGIAPNRYLAKIASELQKPDGLVTINRENITEIFSAMRLEDLCGIKEGNSARLKSRGIETPLAFLRASAEELKHAFRSVVGYQWWLRLHGYEDGVIYKEFAMDDQQDQKSFSQSYALGKPLMPDDPRLWQILMQLTMKMGRRLRQDGFAAGGIGISLFFEGGHWHRHEKKQSLLFTDREFYAEFRSLLARAPRQPIKCLAIACYLLTRNVNLQPSLLPEENKMRLVARAIDAIQDRFGDFVIHPARMVRMEQKVLDRIAFGGVAGLPDAPFQEPVVREYSG